MTLKKILRYIVLVGLFVVPFIPLVVLNSLFFPFITGKGFLFRVVIEVVLAAWAVLAVSDRSYRPKKSWIFYFLFIFVVIMALADAFGKYPFKSFWSNYERMEGWVTLAHLLAYFVVMATVFAKEKLWDRFFGVSFGASATVVLYSVVQYANYTFLHQGTFRVDSTLGNASYLAVYSLIYIFLAVLFLMRKREGHALQGWMIVAGFNIGFFIFLLPYLASLQAITAPTFILWAVFNIVFMISAAYKKDTLAFWAMIVINLFALYNTATRGAMIGLIIGVALAGLLIGIFEKERKTLRKTSIAILVGACALVVIFLAVKNMSFVKNNQVLSRFSSISISDPTTLSRFAIWGMAIKGLEEKPVLGWGQENFNYVFNKYYDPRMYGQEEWFDRSHNVVFDWLITGGALGLAFYLLFFGSIIWYAWRPKNNSLSVSEKSVITGMLVAYFINNLFVFDNLTSYLLFVSIAAYVYFKTADHSNALDNNPHNQLQNNRVIAPAALVVLLAVIWSVNAYSFLANVTLISALKTPTTIAELDAGLANYKKALAYESFGSPEIREQLVNFAGEVASVPQNIPEKQQFITLATDELKKQIALTPEDTRYNLFLGSFYSNIGDTADAIPYLKKALATSPKKQTIMFTLADAYINESDYKDAFSTLKQAYDVDPSIESSKLAYAAGAVYVNNLDLTDSLIKGVASSTVAENNDFNKAYYLTKNYGRLLNLWKQRVSDSPSASNELGLASAYYLDGFSAKAISEAKTAETLDPSVKTQADAFIKQVEVAPAN